MKIYIPSRGRADDRLLKGPAAQMPPGLDVSYVVPPSEADAYRAALHENGVAATVIECDQPGIARTRFWIGQHADRNGHSKFCMMDDDIGFLVRSSPDSWKLRGTTPAEVGEAISWLEGMLDKYAHASLSTREGNNRPGTGSRDTMIVVNTRTLRVLAYRTRDFLSVKHCRVLVMEDFDVNLQILENGGENVVSFWYAQGQRMTNEDGGCSTYRSHALHEACAKKLAKLHPGLVQLRQKQNKTDADGFGTRTEVTIQWKAAAAKGQKNAEQQ